MRAIVGTPRFEGGECVLDGAGGIDIVDIAKQIVRTSLNLTDQDVLLIHAWRHTTPLAAEIAREAIKTCADTSVNYFDDDLWIAEVVERDGTYASKRSPSSASTTGTA